jgi:5-oxoprolinase (ATP-hydrolysing)
VTDANVMVGKLIPAYFPPIFGEKRDQPLDVETVGRNSPRWRRRSVMAAVAEEVADGFIQIAVANMAEAIKKISVQRGYDITRYALNSFGGAGGQHACLVADALGIKTVLLHPFSGLLSAYGMGLAEIRSTRTAALDVPLDAQAKAAIAVVADKLAAETRNELTGQGVPDDAVAIHVRAHIRYAGTDTAIAIAAGTRAEMQDAFQAAHRARFGFIDETKALVIEAVEVEAVGGGAKFEEASSPEQAGEPAVAERTRLFSKGQWHDAAIVRREAMQPGQSVAGTRHHHRAQPDRCGRGGLGRQADGQGSSRLVRAKALVQTAAIGTKADPVMLEIFNNLFMSIAEQMGVTLQNTAYSVNIKERLDFSCAVFDTTASLVANAPHMPVHLGSMDKSVETVIKNNPVIKPGDVYCLNAPYNGGTHLPDITVCTPVFDAEDKDILFWVASRGHHADVGGTAPGSMSPLATNIEEEGVYIDNFKIVDQGRFCEEDLVKLLTGRAIPSAMSSRTSTISRRRSRPMRRAWRNSEDDRLLRARRGPGLYGPCPGQCAESVARLLTKLHDAEFTYPMDQGCAIKVKITIDRDKREATVDFTGTSPQREDNFNAPAPVTRAAVLYVFRVMVDDAIPMNAGCLRPIRIIVPDGSMLSPRYPAAVVAGNVEVSQAVTNTLFGALEAMSASQGTMNNLTFGNDEYQYYETICSGSPAGPGFNGTSGVHVHMTNSRLTDPEILETRFPVVLEDGRPQAARHGGDAPCLPTGPRRRGRRPCRCRGSASGRPGPSTTSPAAARKASSSGPSMARTRPGLVQNWPAPRVRAATKSGAIFAPRAFRAAGSRMTGLMLLISA